MGLPYSRLSSEQLADLRKHTHYDTKQLKKEHKEFLKKFPSGQITKDQFASIFRPNSLGSDPELTHLFNAFDKNRNGKIDFNEFMYALAMTRGEPLRETLELAFRCYDKDGDGYIDYDEVLELFRSVKIITEQKYDSEELAGRIFNKKDKNGRLKQDEFMNLDQDPIFQPILDVVFKMKRAT